ncbi:MAG TPA: ParA family protein, partial [Acidimicrobiia bacterium]|nr:ParA family protein [Acidimicrobiia bacterium]
MLTNTIAFANGKGGVGKTSVTANVAGIAALSGWRVLTVDLDPQG